MKRLILVVLLVLPSRLRIFVLRMLGHRIGRNCFIGAAWLDVVRIEMEEGSFIGHLNVFKGLRQLTLGTGARVGRYNVFTASRHYSVLGGTGHGVVTLAPRAVITMRHYFDCQAAIAIGEDSLIAGIGTVFFTHQKGIAAIHEAKPIDIGPRVYVGGCAVVLPGAVINGHAYVVSGSTIGGKLEDQYCIYASPRAVAIKTIAPNAAYFQQDRPTVPFD